MCSGGTHWRVGGGGGGGAASSSSVRLGSEPLLPVDSGLGGSYSWSRQQQQEEEEEGGGGAGAHLLGSSLPTTSSPWSHVSLKGPRLTSTRAAGGGGGGLEFGSID